MAYVVFLDGVALPVTPSEIKMKIKNQNKTINLINEGEVNVLKSPGLTEISFTAMIPYVRYPFAFYPDGFKDVSFYLKKLEELKVNKKPFRFVCTRRSPSGGLLFDTDMKVSLEDYSIDEEASEGQLLTSSIQLKQYKNYETKSLTIDSSNRVTVESSRPAESATVVKSYTVKKGDTLWGIAKKYLGNGSRYNEIYILNKDQIKNPNQIYVGQVLTMPS